MKIKLKNKHKDPLPPHLLARPSSPPDEAYSRRACLKASIACVAGVKRNWPERSRAECWSTKSRLSTRQFPGDKRAIEDHVKPARKSEWFRGKDISRYFVDQRERMSGSEAEVFWWANSNQRERVSGLRQRYFHDIFLVRVASNQRESVSGLRQRYF